MAKLRVGIVDDSAFVRTAVRRIVEGDARFEVAWEAGDGAQALALLQRSKPDVVTMDYNMPGATGDVVVRRMLALIPVPIVMLSAHTVEGARATIDALAAGAIDVVSKPGGEVSFELQRIGPELLSKLFTAASVPSHAIVSPRRPSTSMFPAVSAPSTAPPRPPSIAPISLRAAPESSRLGSASMRTPVAVEAVAPRVVVIGASTGGPAAIASLFGAFRAPPDFGAIVVQHMASSALTQALAARLDGLSGWKVREAVDGDRIRPGLALVAPGDRHVTIVAGGAVRLTTDPPQHGVRPSVDVTMRACALAFAARCVGVVLTGMGRDGAVGLASIHAAGGRTLAQDQTSSVVFGMPRAAIELGVVDEVAPLGLMADAIGRACAAVRAAG